MSLLKLEGPENGLNILLHCLLIEALGYDKVDIVVILMIVEDRNSGKVIPNVVLICEDHILFGPLIIANGW